MIFSKRDAELMDLHPVLILYKWHFKNYYLCALKTILQKECFCMKSGFDQNYNL